MRGSAGRAGQDIYGKSMDLLLNFAVNLKLLKNKVFYKKAYSPKKKKKSITVLAVLA